MLSSIISSQLVAIVSETQPKNPSSLAALLTSPAAILHSQYQIYHFSRGSARNAALYNVLANFQTSKTFL